MRGGGDGLESYDTDDLVEIARFPVSFEGEVLVARLRAGGIRAALLSADADGWAPHFNLIQGARVMVHREDLERTRDLLAE